MYTFALFTYMYYIRSRLIFFSYLRVDFLRLRGLRDFLPILTLPNVRIECCAIKFQYNVASPIFSVFKSSHQRCSIKKVFFEISQNSKENTCSRVEKKNLAQVFSSEFCEICKNTFITEHLWTTA